MAWVPYERIHFVTAWRRNVVHVHEPYREMAAGTGLPWRWGAETMEPDRRADVCVVAPGYWWGQGLGMSMPWLNRRDTYTAPGFTTLCKVCEERGLPLGREVPRRSDESGTRGLRARRVLDL